MLSSNFSNLSRYLHKMYLPFFVKHSLLNRIKENVEYCLVSTKPWMKRECQRIAFIECLLFSLLLSIFLSHCLEFTFILSALHSKKMYSFENLTSNVVKNVIWAAENTHISYEMNRDINKNQPMSYVANDSIYQEVSITPGNLSVPLNVKLFPPTKWTFYQYN